MNTVTGRREELLVLIRSLRESVSRLQAVQVEATAEVARLAGDERSAAAELALEPAISRQQAGKQVALATELTSRLPHTFAALRAGTIDIYKPSKVAGPVAALSDEQAAEVDREVAPRLAGKDPTGIRRAVQRVVLKVDPEGAEARARAQREQRKLQLVHQDEGTATLVADLPVEVASAIYARCDRRARQLRREGDQRTLEQLRADTFAELLLGDSEGAGGGRSEVYVYLAATTLLGVDDEPGELAGHGYIPAWLAREIAGKPDSVWRRIVTDPLTGHPIDLGRTRYKPPAALDEFVRVRDRECRTPGCYRPAQLGQNDHSHDWDHGGHTAEKTLIGYCETHHHLKHHPDWTCEVDSGVLTITTPTGNRYTSTAQPLHEPLPLVRSGPGA